MTAAARRVKSKEPAGDAWETDPRTVAMQTELELSQRCHETTRVCFDEAAGERDHLREELAAARFQRDAMAELERRREKSEAMVLEDPAEEAPVDPPLSHVARMLALDIATGRARSVDNIDTPERLQRWRATLLLAAALIERALA